MGAGGGARTPLGGGEGASQGVDTLRLPERAGALGWVLGGVTTPRCCCWRCSSRCSPCRRVGRRRDLKGVAEGVGGEGSRRPRGIYQTSLAAAPLFFGCPLCFRRARRHFNCAPRCTALRRALCALTIRARGYFPPLPPLATTGGFCDGGPVVAAAVEGPFLPVATHQPTGRAGSRGCSGGWRGGCDPGVAIPGRWANTSSRPPNGPGQPRGRGCGRWGAARAHAGCGGGTPLDGQARLASR